MDKFYIIDLEDLIKDENYKKRSRRHIIQKLKNYYCKYDYDLKLKINKKIKNCDYMRFNTLLKYGKGDNDKEKLIHIVKIYNRIMKKGLKKFKETKLNYIKKIRKKKEIVKKFIKSYVKRYKNLEPIETAFEKNWKIYNINNKIDYNYLLNFIEEYNNTLLEYLKFKNLIDYNINDLNEAAQNNININVD